MRNLRLLYPVGHDLVLMFSSYERAWELHARGRVGSLDRPGMIPGLFWEPLATCLYKHGSSSESAG